MPIFGHVDGNAFYVSAERAFNPRLRIKPVIVLSNNDGCAVSRSDEAKALGIKMGAPWFKLKNRPEMAEVEALSSNYPLYGDMSRRMYEVLASMVPKVEPYSVDESFFLLDGIDGELVEYCHDLKRALRQAVKIPTCIGLGPTKTIAKMANKIAKKEAGCRGVCDLRSPDIRATLYSKMPINEVWGIGGRTAERLEAAGISTVAEFVEIAPGQVREMLTVVGARIQSELRGVSCLPLSLMAPSPKGMAVTRSFGRALTTWLEIREAVAAFATRAAEKLREHDLVAGSIVVLCHTNPHNNDPPYSGSRSARIEPTNDSIALIKEATRLLQAVWKPGFRYTKAGVMLNDLLPVASQPKQLFSVRDSEKAGRVMAAMDLVNARFGRGTVRPLAVGTQQSWKGRSENLSPAYTTDLTQIMAARAI